MRHHGGVVTRLWALFLAFLLLAGCSRDEEVSALCRRAPELESSLVAVNEGLAELGTASSVVLQSSFAVLLDTLSVMLEVPPREARADLETVERAYREVSIALRNVYWDTSLAVNDTNVRISLENLSRSDNVAALEDIKEITADLCLEEISSEVPLLDGDSTTLPAPVPVVEPLEEYEFVFDDEPSAMASYGYLIAGGRSVSLTESEATCVGKSVTDAAQNSVFDDEQFERVVDEAMALCGVDGFAPITTSTTTQ